MKQLYKRSPHSLIHDTVDNPITTAVCVGQTQYEPVQPMWYYIWMIRLYCVHYEVRSPQHKEQTHNNHNDLDDPKPLSPEFPSLYSFGFNRVEGYLTRVCNGRSEYVVVNQDQYQQG